MTATGLPAELGFQEGFAWFCLRSQIKHEHIAAAHLGKEGGVEVYLPRIRFKRATRRGPVWFTEALFPSYLFARFDLNTDLLKVCYARGVRGVVHFGDRWPIIPDNVIQQLQATVGPSEVRVISHDFTPGETVEIAGGAFHGLSAVVTRVMPSQERVAVLLEFLGQQTTLELPHSSLLREKEGRASIL